MSPVTTVNFTFGAVLLIASRDDESRTQFVSSPNPENLPGGDDPRMLVHSATLASAKASISLGLAVGSKCRSESQMNLEAGSAAIPRWQSSTTTNLVAQASVRPFVILIVSCIARQGRIASG